MAKITGSSWQFSGVPAVGARTLRVLPFAETSALLVERENLPVGSWAVLTDSDTEITGPYLKITISVPSDITGVFTFNGKIRVLRRVGAFCRDAEDETAHLVYDDDIGGGSDREEPSVVILDQDLTPGELYYYTVFFGTEDHWAFSPHYGHARNYAYKNETRNGAPYSNRGEFLYKTFPSGVRYADLNSGGNALEKLCNILGRVFDQLKEDADFFDRNRFSIDKADAARIPFIDYPLGWQTNLELSEQFRRLETKNLPELIKTRGTFAALELVLQALTGWDIEIVEGHHWALKTADFRNVLPDEKPDDWDDETDGDWDELNDIPTQTLFDAANPNHVHAIRTHTGRASFMLSNERVTEHGYGWHWQNENGVLIKMLTVDPEATLQSEIVRKVARIAAILLPRWVVYSTLADMSSVEEDLPDLDDSFYGAASILTEDEDLPQLSTTAFDTADGWSFLRTYSPEFVDESILYGADEPSTVSLRTFSAWLGMV